ATTEIYTLSLHDALPISLVGTSTFNEAAASMPRKSGRVRDGGILGSPSMRPRHRCRGNIAPLARVGRIVQTFNEAAASMPRKCAALGLLLVSAEPSMRPRHRCRGNGAD